MKHLPIQGRTLALLAVIVPLLALFVYVGLRSGPLAPVAVTVMTVESRAITPALFGIGTVEARYTYKIGPTFAGRVKNLEVHVGDQVTAGQVLGEMDPVDLDDRLRSQQAAFRGAKAALREAQARQTYAQTQVGRYKRLFAAGSTSDETLNTKQQELAIAAASLSAAYENLARIRSDQEALVTQQKNLQLIAPHDGVVASRDTEPGTTVVAGQAVLELIDPESVWVNVRFDQISAAGLAKDLPARIVLRSRSGQTLSGGVLRVELKADAVTEEMLAKVVFDELPQPLPPLGELAEVTVDLPALPVAPTISNAAIRRDGNSVGVWQIVDDELRLTPVTLGVTDLDGSVQVRKGIKEGDQIVLYSEQALTSRSRIEVVDRIPGVSK
ncbi:RND family efflux transporter MFP subunit [Marinobacter sp. LV10R520-4]|uniref:efflux RND transporter periplasmic adaptor subunit n=1 Tax=Marinobacter sp. LV10R520-4 TaxID=1761796 RepID=UPI000BF6BA4F|nr:efflux RND transporter periplasmic adaptor subunit [Marinobacter sp. LV10R520-4]PFG54384.1 RND family efflux transporter MFP subunit [Marinobacter sp. LV10R520-4]